MTNRNIPADLNLQQYRCENLKSSQTTLPWHEELKTSYCKSVSDLRRVREVARNAPVCPYVTARGRNANRSSRNMTLERFTNISEWVPSLTELWQTYRTLYMKTHMPFCVLNREKHVFTALDIYRRGILPNRSVAWRKTKHTFHTHVLSLRVLRFLVLRKGANVAMHTFPNVLCERLGCAHIS
jgi:hypothetical protein